jgi:hypothetical protein
MTWRLLGAELAELGTELHLAIEFATSGSLSRGILVDFQ